MSSSELIDALNPYASRRSSIASSEQHAVYANAAYAPHRSDLELAIQEPPHRSQHTQQRLDLTQRRPSQVETTLAFQGLIRRVHANWEESHAADRNRLLQWQQEQEARLALREAECDRNNQEMAEMRREMQEMKMMRQEMRREMDQLRAALYAERRGSTSGYPFSPSLYSPASIASQAHHYQLMSPPSSDILSPYDDGYGPDNPLPLSHFPDFSHLGVLPQRRGSQSRSPPVTTPASSQGTSSETPDTSPSPEAITVPRPRNKRRGRSRTQTSSSPDSSQSRDSSRSHTSRPPRKRLNHRDKRCLTIQHAVRAHFWLMLKVDCDGPLPESHIESETIEPHQPVRFVWDKTTKQSVHNQRMKNRILADLKEHRSLYDQVPKKDFGKKTLDAAFEQCFTTFRQKYRAQTDEAVALQARRREEAKAKKARHVSRRKTKLSNRSDSRMKLPEFQDVVFDAALQMECMSSEESDMEDGARSTNTLRTRGYAWRSSRLLRFYMTLDREETSDKAMKPRRGVGKRCRIGGPPKEGDVLPPKGIATWMISRRWLKVTKIAYPDLPQALESLVDRAVPNVPARFNHLIGEESDLSDDFEGVPSPVDSELNLHSYTFPPQPLQMPTVTLQPHHHSTSSSLQNALFL